MARKSKARPPQRPADLTGTVVPVVTPTVDPAIFAPLNDDWSDEDEPELESQEPAPDDDTDPSLLLELRPITDQDVDRLWDWVREDPDRGAAFFGFPARMSREVHVWVFQLLKATEQGLALSAALDMEGVPVGLAAVSPIRNGEGNVLLYLASAHRHRFKDLVPLLLARWDREHPDLSLCMVTTDPKRMRLYRPFGFDVTYVLRRAKPEG